MEEICLDVHTHLLPIDAYALNDFEGVVWEAAEERLFLDGHLHTFKPLFRSDALLDWMNLNNVREAWVSIPPLAYRQHLSERAARAWAAYINRGLIEIAERHRPRLMPLFHLPVEHPSAACDIVLDLVKTQAAQFAMAAGGGPNVILSDAAYEPLWRELDRAKAFVFIHPQMSCDPRLCPFYLHNLLGNPLETSVAAAHLLFSGALDRHSNMQICLAHGGGATAMVAGRFARGCITQRPGIDGMLGSPSRTLHRLFVDCIVHDAGALDLAITVHGREKILFGSDWPFPMGLINPHRQLADVDGTDRRAIFWENAEAVKRGEVAV